jgi:hypothetical protein
VFTVPARAVTGATRSGLEAAILFGADGAGSREIKALETVFALLFR